MRTYDNGCGFTVTFSAADVDRFASRWPCCDLIERRGFFQFENNGDIANLDGDQPDGEALTVFSRDCQTYGAARIDALRKRRSNRC